MNDQANYMVFAALPSFRLIDNAVQVGSEWVASYSRKSLAELTAEYGEVRLMSISECNKGFEAHIISEPVEITETRFIEMLEVLPPLDLFNNGRTASFKMSEMYSGNITSIFVRVAKRYFEFKDRASLTHAEILGRVLEVATAQDAEKELQTMLQD